MLYGNQVFIGARNKGEGKGDVLGPIAEVWTPEVFTKAFYVVCIALFFLLAFIALARLGEIRDSLTKIRRLLKGSSVWECSRCNHDNPVKVTVCESCGTDR